MLIAGVRDFSIHEAGKKPPCTIVCDADGSCGNHNLRGTCTIVLQGGD